MIAYLAFMCKFTHRHTFYMFLNLLLQIYLRLLLLLEQPIWIFIFLWYFDFRMGGKKFFNLLIGCREIRLLLLERVDEVFKIFKI